jgi:6-phosphofructokinase 1
VNETPLQTITERGVSMIRIGMLTSGGDCQALNAAMRGVAKTLYNSKEEVEIYGFLNGYQGLIHGRFRLLTYDDFSGILTKGGTFLGSSRTPFKTIQVIEEDGIDKVAAMKQTYYKLQLDCLVILGGNGTHKTANLLSEQGLNVVTLPKTIDNDLWGTDMTFGFQSAVDIATQAIDCIHTTAASHGRVFIVEVMGHKVGWLTLNAGMAGGADIILIPEIPYDIDKIVDKIEEREKSGSKFTIIAVAEGAVSKKKAKMSKKDRKKADENSKYPSVSYEIAAQILEKTGREVRVTVPGHTQRGGSPCPYDRVFATRLGAEAGELILNNEYGFMVGYRNREIVKVPLDEVAGKLKYLDPDATIIKEAKLTGICFGD